MVNTAPIGKKEFLIVQTVEKPFSTVCANFKKTLRFGGERGAK